MKPIALLVFVCSAATFASAQISTSNNSAPASDANPRVRHIVGLEGVKRNATGSLSVQNGILEFKGSTAGSKVQVSSVDDIFIGTEVTQGGGRTGSLIKKAAIAAPYGSSSALPILMRTKVDILTVTFRDADGALHGAIFALPKGKAGEMRDQLVRAGAHATPLEN
jgi:hypothetical protein